MDGFVSCLVDIFLQEGLVSASEAKIMKEEFEGRSKEAFDIFLLSEGLISKPNLLKSLSKLYDVPYFDVVGYFFDHEILKSFPKDFLLTNSIIPVQLDANVIIVVASEPDDENLRLKINEFCGYFVEFRVGLKRDIQSAIREYYDSSPGR